MKTKNNRVIFFDTTLRDGEQSPGASLNTAEKVQIANQLAKLGVDVIEAGFPASSPGDFEAVKVIAQKVPGPIIAGLCRAHQKDIDACWGAVKYAKKPRIHLFIATSDIHIEKKLQKTREDVLQMAINGVKYAKSLCKDVEFSAEDAVRSNFDYLCKVIESVIDAGATTVNIPDTVGYAMPQEYGTMIKNLIERVKNINKAIVSVHCHNDLGLAVANSLAALSNGARQVECTINGIGERAGNAALEEIVMSLKTRKPFFNLKYGINTREIARTSKLVSTLTGITVQPNKAIVGENAFAHEAGIHQDGMLKEPLTYEIMNPEDVGVNANALVLGKHSGRHALAKRLKDMGYTTLKHGELETIFAKFKVLADKKKYVFDDDISALVEEDMVKIPKTYTLEYFHTASGLGVIPTATMRISKLLGKAYGKKNILQEASCGDGPVDAAYKAVEKITGYKLTLTDYAIRAVSAGKDAQGEVNLKVKYNGKSYVGRSASTDIIEASVRAYLQAVNRIAAESQKKK